MVIRTEKLDDLMLEAVAKKIPEIFPRMRKKRVTINTKWVVKLDGKVLSPKLDSADKCYDFIKDSGLVNKLTTIDVV